MYRHHIALLMERFPLLGLLAPSFDYEEIKCEAFSKWPSPLPDVEVLYVYGVSVEAYRKLLPWLHENPKRTLIFLENRKGKLGALLHREGAADLLKDLQIEIHLLPKGIKMLSQALEVLVKAHLAKTLDVFALPSRKTSYFYSLRLSLLRKTMLAEAIYKDRLHGYQLFLNFIRNTSAVPYSFYVNALRLEFKDIPAVICGAGPSLTSAFSSLKTLENKALIFACGSAIAALSREGIIPHFCIAVDPNEEEFLRLKHSFLAETAFLYSTRVHPDVFSAINGPFGYVRSQFNDVSQLWLEEELGLSEPLIGHQLSSESISVTSMAVAIAEYFGCSPILFAGLDMAYTSDQRYCSAVGVNQTAKESSSLKTADRLIAKKDKKGKKVYSAVRWVMESSSLSHYKTLHPHVQFINTTEGGIGFSQIPYEPLDQVVSRWSFEYDLRGRIHAAISRASLSNKAQIIPQKLQELKESLVRLIERLRILSSGENKKACLLAELDIKEEIAFSVLFYDVFSWIPERANKPDWAFFLEQAERYLYMLALPVLKV